MAKDKEVTPSRHYVITILTWRRHVPLFPKILRLEFPKNQVRIILSLLRSPYYCYVYKKQATYRNILIFPWKDIYYWGKCGVTYLPRTYRFYIYFLIRRQISSVLLYCGLKGSVSWDFWVLSWHVWIDLGLYKNLWLFLIFSVEPLILYLRLKFRRGQC